ncbi:MAG: HAD hydrolase-like protein [Clostridia bacterium]|nr:HAD hydrolase-like protein [Clostridia bacterium]
MRYPYVFFDLDGTLTDPAIGITNAVMYALQYFGIDVADRRELYPFIGPPLKESFEKFYQLTSEQAEEALREYRVYFSDKGLYENTVYDGIPALLQALCDNGCKVVLATSKPAVYAERILEHFDLRKYFTFVSGSELNGDRVDKAEVIRYALDALHITDVKQVIMVGDRCFDVEGAATCGVDAIGVTYGYGNAAELNSAIKVVNTVQELQEVLL